MITTIILIGLFITGIFLSRTYDYDLIGGLIVFLTTILLLVHVPAILLTEYDYEIFVEKRDAFQATLEDSRINGNDLEAAAIVKEVSQWNIDLATRKYDNTTWFLDQYIDDRIMNLKPIK